jgi:hypothetical protein
MRFKGELLKKLRKESGYTQEKLSDITKIPKILFKITNRENVFQTYSISSNLHMYSTSIWKIS